MIDLIKIVKSLHKYHHTSYNTCTRIIQQDKNNQQDQSVTYLTPFYVGIVYGFILVIIHWLTLAIIGIRIYADNFAVKRNESSDEPETGSYRSSPFTRYMIFCGFFLPIASTIQYILNNMNWLTPVYEVIGYIKTKNELIKYHQLSCEH